MPRAGQPPLHPDGRHPGAARGHRGQDPARLGLRGGGQPGARHQRRQAGGGQRVRRAVRPRRRGAGARPLLDDLPGIDRAGRRDARHRVSDETTGFRSSVEDLEAAWTPRTKALLFVSPSNPTGAVYTRDEIEAIGQWAVSKGDLGADRRDLRASRLRRRRAPLHARGRARAGRPLPGGQRRGQDVRHDRLAGGVAHRPERRHRRRDQHPEPRDLQRRQRLAARRAGRRVGQPRRRGHDARARSTAGA